jgi:DNA-directed RNA polymerase specialized sigma24 family protein
MASEHVLRLLRAVVEADRTRQLTDLQLLDRFVQQHDPDAFTALVQRYGPMVWDLCRRLLRRIQDAEDVFQATFMVLAAKAGTIRKPGALASWLHGVALRIARRARRSESMAASSLRGVHRVADE